MTVRSFLTISFYLCLFGSCSHQANKAPMKKHTNSLIHESSPYLLQHAHNPVDWHAWNTDNLAEAKNLGKPILISIGYSSCHRCHVMEHESFENEKIAAYMNEHFYCIKVDREERPDVDQIYMTAANIITGGGGWPLNCFALPDARPFHAGTYYPAEGWLKLLETVTEQYTNNIEKLEDYATKLTKGIALQETAISDNISQKLDTEVLLNAVEHWKSSWDTTEGGINRTPKFPMPSNYLLLIDYNYQNKDKQTADFVALSLKKMAYGGIFDQIGGGFSRYSVDGKWKVPHFEKMLYDNAQLLPVYSKAYKMTKNPLYLQVIQKTSDWLQREMKDKSNMFYAAIDADSEGEEGKYYVWTSEELHDILGENFDLASAFYQVDRKGAWENGSNILLRDDDLEEIAKQFSIEKKDAENRIKAINNKLLTVRQKRIPPGIDDKCLTAWNGLLVSGLCETYKATHKKEHLNMAMLCLDAILEHQLKPKNQLLHTYKNGESTIDGMLDDYAFVTEACLSVYQLTGDENYLTLANQLTQYAIRYFYDIEKEIFYFNKENELIVRTTEIHDNVIPATNSAMAHVLLQLGLIFGNTEYLSISENLVGKVQQNISEYPGSYANWARVHLKHSAPFYEIAVVGEDAVQIANEFHAYHLPNALIVPCTQSSEIPLLKNRLVAGKTLIYVCKKGACSMPVESIEEALKLIQP